MPINSPSNFQRTDPLRTAFRSGHVADRQSTGARSTKEINVNAGDIDIASDEDSVLHTTGLSDCCAICLLSDKDQNGVYRNRQLAHLLGGCLTLGMVSSSTEFDDFISSIKSDKIQEVIMVNGTNSKSTVAFQAIIAQTVKGEPILKTLLSKNNVKFTALVSKEISIDPKGGWKTHGELIRTLDLIEKNNIIEES